MTEQALKRPLGVKILCVLCYISVFSMILAGIEIVTIKSAVLTVGVALLVAMGVIPGMSYATAAMILWVTDLVHNSRLIIDTELLFILITYLIMIPVLFAISRGLWNLKKWAWTVTMILEGVSLLGNLMSGIVGSSIPAIIIYYLWKNKDLFK